MSFLSMMEANLPPGFRFHPRDDELVCDYLAKKISHADGHVSSCSFFGERSPMIDVDLNKCEPWDLPELACVGGKEWYLLSLRDRKYASGQRTNRATASGYWKATGKDRHIRRKGLLVGMRKTLVFYQGRAPKGSKTDWVMHEFRMDQDQYHQIIMPPPNAAHDHSKVLQEDWVLCRIFYKARSFISSSKPPCSMDLEDTCSNSSSLLPPVVPPMSMSMSMEKYITFGDQPAPLSFLHHQGYHYHEQVPCFSTNAFPCSSTTATMMIPSIQAPRVLPTTKIINQLTPDQFGAVGLPDFGTNHSLDCDNKVVIRALLNHLTCQNMEAAAAAAAPAPAPAPGRERERERERPPAIPTSLGRMMDTYLCDNN